MTDAHRALAPLWIGEADVRHLLPMHDAVDVLERALNQDGRLIAPQRVALAVDGGQLFTMPAVCDVGVGVKLVTVQPKNLTRGLHLIHSVYVLFDADNLAPLALLEGNELTQIRTAAVSALATRHLARADAEHRVVFGAGVQAEAHVEAMRAVRPIGLVTVVDRGSGSGAELVERLLRDGVQARAGDPGAVAQADVICTCTTSDVPVFDGNDLPSGAHVNAIGAYQPHAREVDDATVQRALIVVEDAGAVLAEAGDIVIPLRAGALKRGDNCAELREVVRGFSVRSSDQDVTLFKSVGVGWEDVVLASAICERAS